jgi:hypothetical protein
MGRGKAQHNIKLIGAAYEILEEIQPASAMGSGRVIGRMCEGEVGGNRDENDRKIGLYFY